MVSGLYRICESKMKKIIIIIGFLLFSNLVLAWEITNELNVHEPINDAAVSYFMPNFKNNYKVLDEGSKFSGMAWHSGSAKEIQKNSYGVKRNETFRAWVKIGGIDADIGAPHTYLEKPLRHFYDPVLTPRHLTDLRDSVPNPEIDHITWALTDSNHHWSFTKGLLLYKAAMECTSKSGLPGLISSSWWYFPSQPTETPIGTVPVHYSISVEEESSREYLFAASFRSLGETLHCVADMCLPAHTRDDAHPGKHYLNGGEDPIEANVTHDMAVVMLKNSSVPTEVDFLKSNKSVEQIMIGCALFTNQNFYSNDTVCNAASNNQNVPDAPLIKPRTFCQKFYEKPNFDTLDVVSSQTPEGKFYFASKMFSNYSKGVIMADVSLYGAFYKRNTFVVPPSAAEGQAGVLLPLAAAAGGEIIDRFLPTMKLTLAVAKDGNNSFKLTGNLIHEIDKDPTWKEIGRIKYNGTGTVLVNDSATAVANFVDGIMTPLENQTFKENDKVQLSIKAGALIHTSNVFTVKDEVVSLPKTLVCQQLPEFSYVVSGVGNENSRRVCYFTTPVPATTATVLTNNVDFIVYNWWFDNAKGTAITELYGDDMPQNVFPYHDLSIVAQYGSTAKELPCVERLKGHKMCVPAGNHVLHMVGYFGGTNPAAALIGKPGNYESISRDFSFNVTQPESPITIYKNGEPSEVISFAGEITHEELSNGPDWAPTTWGRGVVQFSGAYNYFPDYAKNPKIMIKGIYGSGLRKGTWLIVTEKETLELDYDISGAMTEARVYDINKSLIRKYSSVLDAQPAFDVVNYDKTMTLDVKTAQVETFGDISERYNLISGIKEGNYQSAGPDGQTVYGQYSGGQKTGTWSFYDPTKKPSDWVVQY